MIHQFDPNFATYGGVGEEARRDGKPRRTDPDEKMRGATPRFYADSQLVDSFLNRKAEQNKWIGVVRRYVRATDERTAIASMVQRTVPIQPLNGFTAGSSKNEQVWALACINSFAYDFMAKLKTPGQDFNVTIMSQVPIPNPQVIFEQLVMNSTRELNYITFQLRDWAASLGDDGPPFIWDEERRSLLRITVAVFRSVTVLQLSVARA